MAGLNLRVGINALQATRELKSLGRALNGVGASAKKAEVKAAGLVGLFAGVGAAATAASAAVLSLGGALAVFGAGSAAVGAIKFSADFQRGLADVNTILREGDVSIERYSEQLLNLSTQSSKTLDDLTRGLYQTISSGIPAVEGAGGAFDVLAAAQKAAVAGLASTEDAVDATVSVLNAYGTASMSATDVTDQLQTAVVLGRVRFEDLAKGIGRVTTIAAQANVPLEDILAVLVQLTRQGIKPAEAITGLRNILKSLINPTKQTKEFLSEFNAELAKTGKSQAEFGAETLGKKGLIRVLGDLTKTTGGSSTALSKLFPNIRALIPALVSVGDGFENVVEFQDQLINSSGATARAAAIIDETFSETFQKFISNLGVAAVAISELPLSELNAFLKEMNELIADGRAVKRLKNSIDELIPSLKVVVDILNVGVVGALSVIASRLAGLSRFIPGVTAGFASSFAALTAPVTIAVLLFKDLGEEIVDIGAGVRSLGDLVVNAFSRLDPVSATLITTIAGLADLVFRVGAAFVALPASAAAAFIQLGQIVGVVSDDVGGLLGDILSTAETFSRIAFNFEAFGQEPGGLFGFAGKASKDIEALRSVEAEQKRIVKRRNAESQLLGFRDVGEQAEVSGQVGRGERFDVGGLVDERTSANTAAELKFLEDELFALQVPIDQFATQFDVKGRGAIRKLLPVVNQFFLDFEKGAKKSSLSAVQIFARLERQIGRLGTVTAAQAEQVAFISAEKVLLEQIVKVESELAELRFVSAGQTDEALIKEAELRLQNLNIQREALNAAKSKTTEERDAAEAIAKGIAARKKRDAANKSAAARQAKENQLLALMLKAEEDRRKIGLESLNLAVGKEKSLLRDLEIEERIQQLRVDGIKDELSRQKLVRLQVNETSGEIEAVLNKDALASNKRLSDAFKNQAFLLEERRDALQNVLNAELDIERKKLENSEKSEEASLKKRIGKLKKLQIELRGDNRPAKTIEEFKKNLGLFQKNIQEASNLASSEFDQGLKENFLEFESKSNELIRKVRDFEDEFVRSFIRAQSEALDQFEKAEKLKNKIVLNSIKDLKARAQIEADIKVVASDVQRSAEDVTSAFRRTAEKELKKSGINVEGIISLIDSSELRPLAEAIENALKITDLDAALKGNLNGAIISLKEFAKGAESLGDPIGDTKRLRETLNLFADMSSEKAELQKVTDIAKLLRMEIGAKKEQSLLNPADTSKIVESYQEIFKLLVAQGAASAEFRKETEKLKDSLLASTGEFVSQFTAQIGKMTFDVGLLFSNLFKSVAANLNSFLDVAVKTLDSSLGIVSFKVDRFFSGDIDIFGEIGENARESAQEAVSELRVQRELIQGELNASQNIIGAIRGQNPPPGSSLGAPALEGISNIPNLEGKFTSRGLPPESIFLDAARERIKSETAKTERLDLELSKLDDQITGINDSLKKTGLGSFFDGVFNVFYLGFRNLNAEIKRAQQEVNAFTSVSASDIHKLRSEALILKGQADFARKEFEQASIANANAKTKKDTPPESAEVLQADEQGKQKTFLKFSSALAEKQSKIRSALLVNEKKAEKEKDLNLLKAQKDSFNTSGSLLGTLGSATEGIASSFKDGVKFVDEAEGFEDFVPSGLFEGALEGFGKEFQSFGMFLDEFAYSAASIFTSITDLVPAFLGQGSAVDPLENIVSESVSILTNFSEFFSTAIIGAFKLSTDILRQGLNLSFELFVTTLESALSPIGEAVAAPLQRLFGSLGSAVSVLADIPDDEDEDRFRKESLELQRAQLENIRLRTDQGASNEDLARVAILNEKAKQEEETALGRLTSEIDRAMKVAVNIADQLGPLVAAFLSKVTSALPKIFPKIVKGLTSALAAFAAGFPDLVITLTQQIVKALPDIIDSIIGLLPSLITGFIGVLTEVLKELPNIVVRLIDSIVENIPLIIDAIIEALPALIEALAIAIPEIVGALIGAIPQIVGALLQSIPRLIGALISAVPLFVGSLAKGFGRLISRAFGPFIGAVRAFGNFVSGLTESSGGSSFLGALGGLGVGLALAPFTGGGSLLLGAGGAALGAGVGYLASLHDGGNITGGMSNQPVANLFRSAGVQGFLDGGMVGDTLRKRFKASLSDDVPAILQRGEGVLSRRGVAAIGGPSAVDSINSGNAGSAPVSVNVGISPSATGLQNAAAALLPLLMGSIAVNVDNGSKKESRTQSMGQPLLGYRTVPGVK